MVETVGYVAAIDAKGRSFDPAAMQAQAYSVETGARVGAMPEWTFDPKRFGQVFHGWL